MKQSGTRILSIILLVLLLILSGVCVCLLFINKTQAKKIEVQKLRYEESEKNEKEWKIKAEELEKELEELKTSASDAETSENVKAEEKDKLSQETAPAKETSKKTTKKTETEIKKEYVDISNMEKAKAKGLVDTKTIDTAHLEKYFKSYPISDTVFKRIYGDDKSFKTYCTVSRDSLVYIKVLHFDYNGEVRVGELIANAAISDDLLYIFQKLFESKYQIEKMVLIEEYGADDDTSVNDNNTSCFNFRYATDSTELSNHATGCAIDINPLQNPYFRVHEDGSYDWDNKDAELYWDRTNDPENRHMINYDDLCYQLFTERGFNWGGNWSNPIDYQHFEKLM